MSRSHIIASQAPLTEGSGQTALCGTILFRPHFEIAGSEDLRFHALKTMVSCRACKQAKEPEDAKYLYGATDAA